MFGGVARSYLFVITGTELRFGSVRGMDVAADVLLVVVGGCEDVLASPQSLADACKDTGTSCSWSFCNASTKPRAKLSWSFSLPVAEIKPDGPPGVMGVGINPLLLIIIRSSSGLASFNSFRSGDCSSPAGECSENIFRFLPELLVALFSKSSLRLDLSKFIVPIRSLKATCDITRCKLVIWWFFVLFLISDYM